MKHSAISSLSVLSLLTGTLTLAGCGGAASFSNPTPPASTVPPTTAQVVAGPPVQGSVYGGHAPIQASHVYLLQPGTTGYGSAATSLLGVGPGTTSPPGFALSTNTGADPNVPIGAKYVTTDATGSFNLTGGYVCAVGQPVYVYAYGGQISATAINNNSIVEFATLGNCPSSGNFSTLNNGYLQYVYLNEVSTIATAYTFQPFTLVTNNDAWHIGTPNTTQALLGIANAANTAAQLYDIQGGGAQSGCTGTPSECGEGHVANYRTVGTGVPNVGNGVVPEATIDTLANIIANCVDTAPVTLGTPTSQCTSLFTVATNNGETGTTGVGTNEPIDVGTAVLNIARFPAGNHSDGAANVDASYATHIFALQGGGTTPYVPQLRNAPNDWTIAINYPYATVGGYNTSNPDVDRAESIQVDQKGQIWITAQGGGNGSTNPSPTADRWSNLGVPNALSGNSNQIIGDYIFGYVSVDGGGNAWTGNANQSSGIYFAQSNGTFSATYGKDYQSAYTVITNYAGDAFFFAKDADTGFNTGTNFGMFEYDPSGHLVGGSPFNISTETTTTGPGPVTQNLNISAASETNSGGTYTYSFNYTYAGGTPPTLLAVGDTVPLTLANDPGTGFGRVPATGWQNLTSVTVASVTGTSFTATGTTPTTNSNDGNGAATTAPITITAATETNARSGGVTTYTYTFHFTNVGTPGAVLAVGDTVPLSLANDPGTGTVPVAATGWQNLTTVRVATVNNGAGTFTAIGGAPGTANIATTNTVSTDTNGATVAFNLDGVTKSGSGASYTYTFAVTNGNAAPLAPGDSVALNLNGNFLGNWAALSGTYTAGSATNNGQVTITSSTNAGNPNYFDGGTGTYSINGATGTGSYAYTNANGASGTGSYVYTGTVTTVTPGAVYPGDNVAHGAIDATGDLWLTSETGYTIARVTPTGTLAFPTITVSQQPEFPAIDASGNAWIPGYETNSVYLVSPTGTLTTLTSANTGASLVYPFGSAVDGNGNVWITNRCGPGNNCGTYANSRTLVEINGTGTNTPGTINTAISPPTNYLPQAQYPATATTFSAIMGDPLNLAIDPSGNIWVTNYNSGGNSSVTEIVGAAAPVVTPLSVAAGTSTLGQKP
jgi:hypothetical protein